MLVLLAASLLDTDELQREARVGTPPLLLPAAKAQRRPSRGSPNCQSAPIKKSQRRPGAFPRLWLRSCGLGGPRGGPAVPRLVTINAIQPPAGSRRLYGQVSDAVRRRVPQGPARNPIFFWQNWHTKGGWHAPRAAFGLQLKAATTRKFWLAAIGQRTVDAHHKEPCLDSTSK